MGEGSRAEPEQNEIVIDRIGVFELRAHGPGFRRTHVERCVDHLNVTAVEARFESGPTSAWVQGGSDSTLPSNAVIRVKRARWHRVRCVRAEAPGRVQCIVTWESDNLDTCGARRRRSTTPSAVLGARARAGLHPGT